MKHWKSITVFTLVAVFVYVAAGFLISSYPQAQVSEDFRESVRVDDFYGDGSSKGLSAERVMCIDNNDEALLWRLRVIESAQSEIIMSTFELKDDESGYAVMSALWGAAQRGVHVRIFIDGKDGVLDLSGNAHFKALISHPNVEAEFYNPMNPLKPWTWSFRMHDKYLIADDCVYLLGGRNTYDSFLGYEADVVEEDRDLLVYETDSCLEDTSLEQLKSYFESIWQLTCCKEVKCKNVTSRIGKAQDELQENYESLSVRYESAFDETDFEAVTIPADKITLISNPVQASVKEPQLWYILCELMKDGEDVFIQTPYIICGEDMYRDLNEVCEYTQDLAVIINSVEIGTNPWGCADYLREKDKIRKLGVTVYEHSGAYVQHTKTVLIDDNISIVGSYNLDMRSTYLDTELMLVVDSGELNAQLRSAAQTQTDESRKTDPDGTLTEGPSYVALDQGVFKQVFYRVLGVLIRPVRFLL